MHQSKFDRGVPKCPGGSLVIATWCQREETPERPFSEADTAALQFLYDEWAHPYFVSVQHYGRLLEVWGTSHCTLLPSQLLHVRLVQ